MTVQITVIHASEIKRCSYLGVAIFIENRGLAEAGLGISFR